MDVHSSSHERWCFPEVYALKPCADKESDPSSLCDVLPVIPRLKSATILAHFSSRPGQDQVHAAKDECGTRAVNLLRQMRQVEEMHLGPKFLEVIFTRPLPIFSRVTSIEIVRPGGAHVDWGRTWQALPFVIEASLQIGVLSLSEVIWEPTSVAIDIVLPQFLEIPPDHGIRDLHRLKEIDMRIPVPNTYALRLVEFFLSDGGALQRMTIGGFGSRAYRRRMEEWIDGHGGPVAFEIKYIEPLRD